jgi:hypothetical protein
MLKIFLQIFGVLALCVIIVLNYNIFIEKPIKEKVKETRKEYNTVETQNKVLKSVLNHQGRFGKLEESNFVDYADVAVFFAYDFFEPTIMARIQKLVDLSGCENDGLKVGRTTKAAKPAAYSDFVTKQKEDLLKSVDSFVKTMDKWYGDAKLEQKINGADSNYGSRLEFYQQMSSGKNFPHTMNKGIEIHRFNLTLTGTYAQCKKFLWLTSQNRPFIQASIMSFVPIKKAQKAPGAEKFFSLKVTILTYVDRNEKMQSTADLTKQVDSKAEKPAEAAKPAAEQAPKG